MKNFNVLLRFVLSNVIFTFPQFVNGDRARGIVEREAVYTAFTRPMCYKQQDYDMLSPHQVRASATPPTARIHSPQKYDINRILILGADDHSKCSNIEIY